MVSIRAALLICAVWAGSGYVLGDLLGYNKGYGEGYVDSLVELQERLDKMDEEEIDTINQTNPKWDI